MAKWVELTNRTGAEANRKYRSAREAAAALIELQEACYVPSGMDYSSPIAESGGPTESDLNDMLDLKRVFYASQRLCDPEKFERFVKVVFCNVPLRDFEGLSATSVAKHVRQCERIVESVMETMGMLRSKG
jgi:hypothetical protein